MIPIRREADGSSFEVQVQPRSSRAAVEGEREGALRLRLTAPPVEGAANRQCIALLSEALDVPKSAVSIVSGTTSKRKRVQVRGLEPAAAEAKLRALCASGAGGKGEGR